MPDIEKFSLTTLFYVMVQRSSVVGEVRPYKRVQIVFNVHNRVKLKILTVNP